MVSDRKNEIRCVTLGKAQKKKKFLSSKILKKKVVSLLANNWNKHLRTVRGLMAWKEHLDIFESQLA